MSVSHNDTTKRRVAARRRLDNIPDFSTVNSKIEFRQTFETLEDSETFTKAPNEIVQAARNILTSERLDSIAQTVRDAVFYQIGCNKIPLFALVSGGRGRTLFEFRCVFEGCTAFLDVRLFSGVDIIKWILMGVSHSHTFSVFPPRMPRSTIPDDVAERIKEMTMKKTRTPEIKMAVGALCNRNVFQNALRGVRKDILSDQCRALRNETSVSNLWSTEIHLTHENVFVEAFFVNTALSPSCIDNNIAFIDDTTCANIFSLPLVSMLCRDPAQRVHAIAWGVVQNRTTASFARFLGYVKNSFPSIQTFVCDRHFGQRKAIVEVFGDSVSIFHCCVHIARNIRSNCGPHTDIISRFWEMRYQRTQAAEDAFIQALRRLHNSRKSLFTAELLNSLASFVPSAIDPVVRKVVFPALCSLHEFDVGRYAVNTDAKARAMALVNSLKAVDRVVVDVFSVDNTNVIEGYFNGIKGRMQTRPLTLLDVFKVVDTTERTVLASGSPFTPKLPSHIRECILHVISCNVFNVISSAGVQHILCAIVSLSMDIITDNAHVLSTVEAPLWTAITTGTKIETFKWMPDEWIIQREHKHPVHTTTHVDVPVNTHGFDILMRLQPFIETAHRSVSVFNTINSALMTLYDMEKSIIKTLMPVNYSFLFGEFSRLVEASKTNSEIKETLVELCMDLEQSLETEQRQSGLPRSSIADPAYQRMRGRQTTSTSAKVDHVSSPPQSKAVDDFQVNTLQRQKKPARSRRRHVCPVCRRDGHHAQTCHDVLLGENTERADAFFARLIEMGRVDSYVASLAKRERHSFVKLVVDRIDALSASTRAPSCPVRTGRPTQTVD